MFSVYPEESSGGRLPGDSSTNGESTPVDRETAVVLGSGNAGGGSGSSQSQKPKPRSNITAPSLLAPS
jgi:hypothetical protein